MKLEDLAKKLPKLSKRKRMEILKNPKKRKMKTTVYCRICGGTKAVIRKYGLMVCRRCFHQYAEKLGWTD